MRKSFPNRSWSVRGDPERSRHAEGATKSAQEVLKRWPGGAQEGPRAAQERPKAGQVAPKRRPIWAQMPPKSSWASPKTNLFATPHFFACFLICCCIFQYLFDMDDPWKTMKNHGFSNVFLIFLRVGDAACILNQHSNTHHKTSRKCMENPRILQVMRRSGRLRGQVWCGVWQLGRQESVKKVS